MGEEGGDSGGASSFGFGEEAFHGCGAVGKTGYLRRVNVDGVVLGTQPGKLDAAAAEVHGYAFNVGEAAGDAEGADSAFFFFGEHFNFPACSRFDSPAV